MKRKRERRVKSQGCKLEMDREGREKRRRNSRKWKKRNGTCELTPVNVKGKSPRL